MAAGVLPQKEHPYSTLVNNSGYAANMKGNSSLVYFLSLCKLEFNKTAWMGMKEKTWFFILESHSFDLLKFLFKILTLAF